MAWWTFLAADLDAIDHGLDPGCARIAVDKLGGQLRTAEECRTWLHLSADEAQLSRGRRLSRQKSLVGSLALAASSKPDGSKFDGHFQLSPWSALSLWLRAALTARSRNLTS